MNSLYGKGREAFLDGQISWTGDTIKAYLIDTGEYAVAIDADEFLSSIPAEARIGNPVTLAGKTKALGVADAANVSFAGLVAAPTIEALVLVQDTGVEGTSRLIAYIDTATDLPIAAGATQADVAWDDGANKLFKL